MNQHSVRQIARVNSKQFSKAKGLLIKCGTEHAIVKFLCQIFQIFTYNYITYTHTRIREQAHTHVHYIHTPIYVHTYIHTHSRMHIHTYTHTHTHIHTYIHTRTQTQRIHVFPDVVTSGVKSLSHAEWKTLYQHGSDYHRLKQCVDDSRHELKLISMLPRKETIVRGST